MGNPLQRTHHNNELRSSDEGKTVTLRGWVDRRRDHGGVIFIDLRDREGRTQVVFNPDFNKDTHALADGLRNEYVIHIEGQVKKRIKGMTNKKLTTGEIEVYVDKLVILNQSLTPAIAINEISEEAAESEDIRLKYRYLDLRRPAEQRLIRLKSKFLHAWRNALHDKGFDEIETPILMKSTPEGARDFLVPSRLHKNKFYALPQSPQTYKQLLMISGFEKYYQVAKCFRDEDLRADRQPEFLQIDCEMSFVECEDIYNIYEEIIQRVMQEVFGKSIETPFLRMTYAEAMLKYGSDKPDLRYALPIADVSEISSECGFKVFRQAVESGGVVRGLAATGCVDFTRKIIDDLTEYVGRYGSKGLVWMRYKDTGVESQVGKFFAEGELQKFGENIGGQPGDMLFFIAGPEHIAATAIGHLRTKIASLKDLTRDKKDIYLWVVDFPMFEYSQTEKRYMAMHHPFTAPMEGHFEKMQQGDLKNVMSKAYDLVLNGVEIGGGSIRIHKSEMQQTVFECLGLSKNDIAQKFGYFVEAFKYGAPPHGGIAFGVDRFLATLEKRPSIRDFIPFPKNSSGISLMENSPSQVESEQLRELHIKSTL